MKILQWLIVILSLLFFIWAVSEMDAPDPHTGQWVQTK